MIAAKLTLPGCHTQVEPASRSPLAASRQASHSNSSSRSHEGFVSVSSASRSSGSQHGTNNLPATAEAAAESSGLQPFSASPTKAKDGATAPDASGTQLSQTSALDTSDGSSGSQPHAADPFRQSLHALHAEQQQSHSQVPASRESVSELEGTNSAQQDSRQPHPTAVTEPQRSGSASQVPTQAAVQERTSSDSFSTAAPSLAASQRASSTAAAGGGVNASPVGSASTDAWEMVQDANNIYIWKAGSLFGHSLSSNRRQGSECSEEGESYSQCELSADNIIPSSQIGVRPASTAMIMILHHALLVLR